MNDTRDKDIADLKKLCVYLVKKSVDDFARIEAMRALLQEHGLFAAEEFEAKLQIAQSIWTKRFEQLEREQAETAHVAAIRRLLEDYEGTKQ